MSSKYLKNGTRIGGHYEIIDVLGEDDFEILYLVKNIHREGSFFVLKELFLDVFSKRDGNSVETIPEAIGVFNKRKLEIITELSNLHRRHIEGEIKVFAYFEENNTIYSCMAYTPNAKVEDYLQFEPKEDTKLPRLEELTQMEEEKKKKGSSLLLISVGLVTIAGGCILLFNQYGGATLESLHLFDNNKSTISKSFPKNNEAIKIVQHVVKRPSSVIEVNRSKTKEKQVLKESTSSLDKGLLSIDENRTKEDISKIQKLQKVVNETNLTNEELKEKVIKSSTLDNNLSEMFLEPKLKQHLNHQNELNITNEINLTKEGSPDNNLSEIFSEQKLKQFLKNYMQTTAHASSKKIMKLYDSKITRYFKFKNITPKKVGKSVRAYNRKWKYRNFKLVDFKILKRYSKNSVNYCDIKTHTKWYVSNPHGKKRSGNVRGFMTIRDGEDGFKVKAIYGIK